MAKVAKETYDISFFDKEGKLLSTKAVTRMRRYSMCAARDHREMDAVATANSTVNHATINGLRFIFVNGKSRMASGQL